MISCFGNNLTQLNTNNNPELYSLECYDNMLTSLDISNNKKLINLYCHSNPGENNVMKIKAWFDNYNIPTDFNGTNGQYDYNGTTVKIEYWCE